MVLSCSSSLKKYLYRRSNEENCKSGLSIVFDVTNYCNLRCRGCCVNAEYISSEEIPESMLSLSTKNVFDILDEISRFSVEQNEERVYLNFGGGEPFIRSDFGAIVRYAKEKIPNVIIAIDTNGTISNVEQILEVSNFSDVIGFSLDGLEESHNFWRNPSNENHGFKKTINLISDTVNTQKLKCKIEVTCVPTVDNIKDIPNLIVYMDDLGIDFFSIHRAIQVGRFRHRKDKIPSQKDYYDLACSVAELEGKVGLNFHFHHSLEEMYRAVFMGEDVCRKKSSLSKSNISSSLAIDSNGNLHIDPWFVAAPWSKLTLGSLKSSSLSELISLKNNSFKSIISMFSQEKRCLGCEVNCTGGSRIAAASNAIGGGDVDDFILRDALRAIDPACPLGIGVQYEKIRVVK